ncbi:IclR family transcriptional regulator [Micrococcus terreus]|uniref:IclR family transcriptional regulator n=1 Tax=Micrococcus terreus TaxID=574650 RepID=UPI0033CFDDA7
MQIIANTIGVVECVVRHQPIGVTEIAHLLDLPKTTVQRILISLEEGGWLARARENTRKWVQTPRLWVLVHEGPGVEISDITRAAREFLAGETNENVHLTQRVGDDMVVIDKIESSHAVRVFDPIGTRVPLHRSASGRAMLSTWSADDLDEYIDRARNSGRLVSADAEVDVERLRTELDDAAAAGVAVNYGQWRQEISGVGTPLPLDGRLNPAPYGLAVSAPSSRFSVEKVGEFSELLLRARAMVLDTAGLTGREAAQKRLPRMN